MEMRVAYLVNQYPHISHAFIRREILAVEKEGCEVLRYSLRRAGEALPDALDQAEATKTRVVLDGGSFGLARAMLSTLLRRPWSFFRALYLALRVGQRSERGLLLHVIYFAEACVFAGWCKRDGIDHVHAHFGSNSTVVAMLCRELGGPRYSFTAHGPEEFDKAVVLALGPKIERASFVAAISSFGRSQLFRYCSFSQWPKIDILRCGVDEAFLGPPPMPMPKHRRLVCVGRLCEQKGQLLLVEAMARLRQKGQVAELLLVGDGPMRPEIETMIARSGLQDTVRIFGWADGATVQRILDESCALVLPSFAEGLPVVIMEAMARARPVLSTYVAGIPELVMPGRNGWLVPAGSADDIVEAIGQILTTPLEQLTEMGLHAREDVRAKHEIGLIARKMVGRFRATLEGEKPTPM
jgi:glycosyltransferase involved in cell wall biosynthesis